MRPASVCFMTFVSVILATTSPAQYLVRDINPGSAHASPQFLTPLGDTLFFRASDIVNGAELWKSDGTTLGTVMVADLNQGPASSDPQYLELVGTTLYFIANDGVHGRELWKSDGTATGTVMVADINQGAGHGIS